MSTTIVIRPARLVSKSSPLWPVAQEFRIPVSKAKSRRSKVHFDEASLGAAAHSVHVEKMMFTPKHSSEGLIVEIDFKERLFQLFVNVSDASYYILDTYWPRSFEDVSGNAMYCGTLSEETFKSLLKHF